ncbi:MAG: queuosine salvage family protein [Myxococcota bacterium]
MPLSDELLARPFAAVREACAEVAASARHVAIDADALARYAAELPLAEFDASATNFPALGGDVEALAAYTLCLDAINFGSGWFPELRKRPGHSGYRTIEASLRERFERTGPFTARELRALDARAVALLLRQTPPAPAIAELMELFASALRDLGELVATRTGGSFAGLVEEAGGSGAALVRSLLAMPLYRDVATHDGLTVPFFKRAQLTVSDLAHALPESLGRFRDLAELTIFADNLVPHVLRCDGVLRFGPELVARIEAGETIAWGSPEEVEIRACAVDAVEQLVGLLRARGQAVLARELDEWLWRRGGRPEYKARPRHRTRCPYY